MGVGMNLARFSQTAIEKAACESGLALTADQVRDIMEAEGACLTESKRVSFGESAAVRVVRGFGESPFIAGIDAAEFIVKLIETFYDLREDLPAAITDAEILESLQESFDGAGAGDVSLAAAFARDELSRQLDYSTYEIADDGGNVYRWDPEEWHDDVMADGWNCERWEDVDE